MKHKPWVFLLILLISTSFYAIAEETKTTEKSETKFKPNPKFKDLPDNTVMELGKFEWEKPLGEPNSGQVTDYSGMTYDSPNHRILLFGGGHSATWTDAIYSFDFETLKFVALYKPTPFSEYKQDNVDRAFFLKGPEGKYPRPVGRHTYDLLVVPDDRKELWMLRSGSGPSSAAPGFGYIGGAIGKYDFKTNQWELIDGKGITFGGYGGVAEYDPESKTIIGILGQTISAFDMEKRTATKILDDIIDKYKDNFGYSGCLVYFPPTKKMIIFGQNAKSVWTLSTNTEDLKKSVLTKVENSGDFPKIETSYVYDTKNKIMGGGISENKFYTFDPIKESWESKEIQGGTPKQITFHCIAYSPIDNVYIFIAANKIWAYRWKN